MDNEQVNLELTREERAWLHMLMQSKVELACKLAEYGSLTPPVLHYSALSAKLDVLPRGAPLPLRPRESVYLRHTLKTRMEVADTTSDIFQVGNLRESHAVSIYAKLEKLS